MKYIIIILLIMIVGICCAGCTESTSPLNMTPNPYLVNASNIQNNDSSLVYHYSTSGSGLGIALTTAKKGEVAPLLVYDLESGEIGYGYGIGL